MCGIAGIYNIDGRPLDKQLLLEMTRRIRYRGPDDEGFMLAQTKQGKTLSCHHDETISEIKNDSQNLLNNFPANLGFGFRRLSILDLSAKGHQPMCSADKRFWIVFNGEIYNYIELRQELKALGFRFKSSTDTEVIIAAYQAWGVECLNRFNGMWAFALWDSKEQKMFAARDRFGIKPFHYFYNKKQFVFGSEIKQILLHNIDNTLNENSIYRSMNLNSFLIYGDETYFEHVKSLPAAHYLLIEAGSLQIKRYYDLDERNFESYDAPFKEAVDEYTDLFKDSVRLRMRSDVEVGSCLSGGLDSSAIVGTAAGLTTKQFQTFSAYYDLGAAYDERKWIDLITNKYNLSSQLVEPKAEEFWDQFDRMTFINDYPVSGASFISQHSVMELAKEHQITVLLDGQGSDEITGGYNHTFYRYYADLLRAFKWFTFAKEFPQYVKYNSKGTAVSKFAKTIIAAFASESTIYGQEAKHQLTPFINIKPKNNHYLSRIKDLPVSRLSNFLYNLISNTMIQTLLHFEDRNSMASSIESRVPFLDYRLVEFAFSLPGSYKVHANFGKYIHREALKQIVPREIAERKDKVSFASPGEAQWLRNELQPQVQELFWSNSFRQRGIFNLPYIDAAFKKYLQGDLAQAKIIWRSVALEKWFRVFMDAKTN